MIKQPVKFRTLATRISAILLGATIGFGAYAADSADATYKAQKDQAEANYESAKARCNTLSGNEKDVCIQQAKAAKTSSKADAEVMHKTNESKKDAAEDKMDAQYKVAKEKCDALTGDEKDACQQRAKAAYK